MKILIAIDTYETNNNGTSISAQRYADVLRQHGHEVRILSVDSEHYRLAERHIYPFDGLIHKHGFRFANSLSRHSQEVIREAVNWCDMVHCMMPFMLSNRVKKMADELGKPATAAFHIQPENLTSSAGLGKVSWITNATYALFYHMVYKHFRHVHTPSQFMADELVKHGYDMHLYPISNGIDPSFHPQPSNSKASKPSNTITIVMTGRLSREKRQDLLLKAVLQSKYADRIQVIFAGKGPLMSYYQRLGERLPLKPIFGYYNRTELQHLLSQTDLYVHASDMESEAIGCIEAFAMGLVPIISDSRLSATRQFALDERSLFEAGNPQSLAERIDYWLEHEDERHAMELRYAEHAKQYHLEDCVLQFEAMINREVWEKGITPNNSLESEKRRGIRGVWGQIIARRVAVLLILLAGLGIAKAHAERVESLPFGNLDTWTMRYIRESKILGGETKTIYALGPADTIRGNTPWIANEHNVPWSTSNVYACVAGIDKASCTVFPERRGNGYCARLENRLESVCAMGIINLKVMAAGTIYTGVTREPVGRKGADEPISVIDFGVPFTGHPMALQFDYKAKVSADSTITIAKSTAHPRTQKAFDCPMISIRLERRWIDSKGEKHVDIVGEGKMLIKQGVTSWKNNTRLPVRWTSPTTEPTHIVIQFSSGCCEPFVGHEGNILWVDNIKLVYNE